MKKVARLALVALSLTLPFAASAELRQPNGKVIPQGNNLRNYLDAEGETIDPLTDAAVTPETFDPFCELTFTVIAAGGGQNNSFGWYNADGTKPANDELYEFIDCRDSKTPGFSDVLQIKDDPRYRGGRIGFFMATTEGKTSDPYPNCVDFGPDGPDPDTLGYIFYSERQYNPDNMGAEASTIHLLIMDSRKYPSAFYFGWEDLIDHEGKSDNDFEDLLMRVEGISCAGGGDSCEADAVGICARGVMQCRNGELACLPQLKPGEREESCNGLDDDCDGTIDEGDDLCGAGKVCDAGKCVDRCMAGEFSCFNGTVCNDRGFCVEPSCADVVCDDGQICVEGQCRAACDGVVCPLGQECRYGSCVDKCDGVVCDAGQACNDGVCQPDCDCVPCAEGKVCAADGRCVDEGCDFIACNGGKICVEGSCVDPCDGAICPEGQLCSAGACIDDGTGQGGSGSGSGGSGGSVGGGGGTSGGEGGSASGTGGSGAGAGGSSGKKGSSSKGGGGCSAASGPVAILGLLGAAVLLRRRGR